MLRRAAPRLALAATAAGGTFLACRHLESQRRPLQGCHAATVPAALESLRTSGVAVVDGLRLDEDLVSAVQAIPAAESMPMQQLPRARQQRRGGAQPKDSPWRLSAVGRYHRRDNYFDATDMKVLTRVERQLWPLVEAFFREDEEGMDGLYRSELQLMTAVPGSANQMWHKDNRTRGLSILVPLVDFTAANGATQLLLGSHTEAWPLAARQGAQVVHAPAGSIVAYDSRTIHRGLGNETAEGRPALIFCYDRTRNPPPGCGTMGSVATSYQGRLLDVLSGMRSALES